MKRYRLKITIITCFDHTGTRGINPLKIIRAGTEIQEDANGYKFVGISHEFSEDSKRNSLFHKWVFPFFPKEEVENNLDLFEEIK